MRRDRPAKRRSTVNDRADGCVVRIFAATTAAFLIARVAARLTAAPRAFAPFTLLPVASGGFGGALAASVIFWTLNLIFEHPQIVFVANSIVALLASFHLPFRLTNHRSPRFAGARFSMQLILCLMHIIVAAVSVGALLLFAR